MTEQPPSPPDADRSEQFIDRLCHFEIDAYACVPDLPAHLLLVAMAAMDDMHSLCKEHLILMGERDLDARLHKIDDMERIAALTKRHAMTPEQIEAVKTRYERMADLISLQRSYELEELLRLPEEKHENNSENLLGS